MKKILLIVFSFFLLFSLSLGFYFFYLFPNIYLDKPIQINIEKGMDLKSVSLHLSAQLGFGRLQSSFLYYHFRFEKLGSKLKTGQYQFDEHLQLKELAKRLSAEGEKLKFTIPEGYNIQDIAKLLDQKQIASGARFKELAFSSEFTTLFQLEGKSLEGYLFPDTYEYHPKMKEEEIIERMLKNFKLKAQTKMRQGRSFLSPYELLTLASIVEKETGKAEERPLIAGVFFNRLKIGMPLATDPSVIYGIPQFDGNLRKADLLRDGPYNTYLRKGLPPTPIANPGLASIESVIHPAQTSYLYFVAKGDSSHYFSVTYEEHKAAVEKYQSGNK